MKNKFFKKGHLFKLLYYSAPILKNNKNILVDNKIGGTLLKYKIKDIIYITLFNKNIIVKYNKFNTITYYFNPLKQYWQSEIYKISKVYWGKKDYVSTRYWIYVDENFKNINDVPIEKLKSLLQCKDHKLIKHLTNKDKYFII